MRTRCASALALCAAMSLAASAAAVVENYAAKIDNAQEQAAGNCLAGSTARGMATATFDTATSTFAWNVTFGNDGAHENGALDHGAETGAHFHIGSPGANGSVALSLSPGSPKAGSAALDATRKSALQAGLFYVNVHSAGCAAGEIRGQLQIQQVPALPLWAWFVALACFAVAYAVMRGRRIDRTS
jgi:hypothetical protein